MTILEMLEQSGRLTLLGMGIVFSFLIIMVIVISAAGKIINPPELNRDVQPVAGSTRPPVAETSAVTAAIGAAVNEYKKNN